MRRPTRVHRLGRPPYPDVLTPAEWEVLGYLRRGMSNNDIAIARGTSIDAVKYHLGNIRLKLAMEDRSDLMESPGMPSIRLLGINNDQDVRHTIRDFDVNPKTGEIAILVRAYDRTSRVEIVTSDGRATGGIPPSYISQWPRWSGDGSCLYFFGNSGPLYRKARNDTEPEVILDDPAGAAGFQAWAPDGTKVTYQFRQRDFMFGGDPRHKLHMLDVATGQTTQITDDQEAYDVFFSWSPSGRWVAIERVYLKPERREAVFLYEVGTGELIEVRRQRCLLQRHGWHPDSQHLLVRINSEGGRRIEIIRIGDMKTVWSHESPDIEGGAFSPDGEHVLCATQDELQWYAFPSGEVVEQLSLKEIGTVVGFAPGPQVSFGQQGEVYFLTRDSRIYRWEVGGDCSLVIEPEPPPPLPAHAQENYTVTSRDGVSIPVHRYIPPNPKPVAVMYADSYGTPGPRKFLIPKLPENGSEVVFPAHRGMEGSPEDWREARRGDVGRGEVWDLLACAQDWKRRTGGDRPLVIFGSSIGGLYAFLGLAQDNHPWDGAVMMAPLARIEIVDKIWPWALLEDSVEREAALVDRSPIEQAHKIRVPVRMFHGGRDEMSNVEDVREIQRRIDAAGGECILTIYEDDIHLLGRHRDEITSETLAFLARLEQ